MKAKLIISFCVILLSFSSCTSFGGDDDNKDEILLMTLHYNDDNKLAEGSYLSLLTVTKNEETYTRLNELYPMNGLNNNADVQNQRVAIGLHSDFNVPGTTRQNNGAWFDISSGSWLELPLLPAGDDRYNYFDVTTAKVSQSGHIFYLSSSNVKSYHDQYNASLVRFDPDTEELLQASNPTSFVLGQPEKKWDTEAGQFVRQFYPSADGRYVYGVIETFGVDGGSIHWDYEILFQYDFKTDQYTRLGEAEDNDLIILGMTSDGQNILYSSKVSTYKRKIVRPANNSAEEVTINGGQAFANTSKWNSSSYCSGETNNTIGIYNVTADTKEEIRTPSRPYFAQFSSVGDQIYFMIESGAKKYICRTSDLTAGAIVDTVCTLQSNVYEFIVVK